MDKKKIVQDLIASATKSFVKDQGRPPNNLENILLKQKAINAYLEKQKVVDFPQDKITPFYEDRPTAGIMQASKIQRPGKVIENEKTKKMFDDFQKRQEDKQGFRVIPGDSPEAQRIMDGLLKLGDKAAKNFVDDTIAKLKKMTPMNAMKEANRIIKREGRYDLLEKNEAKQILDATEDHIFQRGVKENVEDKGITGTGAIRQAYDEATKKGTFKGTYDEFLNYIDDLVDNDFATGGRVGLRLGSKGRRDFLKLLGAATATGAAAKTGLLKIGASGTVKKQLVSTPPVAGKPEWFDKLVNKVITEGDDVTKKLAVQDKQTVHKAKINETDEVTVYQNLDDGQIDVIYDSPTNMGEDSVNLTFKPGLADETTKGKKPPDEFFAEEAEPRYTGGPEDADIEFDGVGGGSSVKMLESDVTPLKEFAGEKITTKDIVNRIQKNKRIEAINNDKMEQAEFISGKYGDGPEPDIDDQFASGGIAGMLGE